MQYIWEHPKLNTMDGHFRAVAEVEDIHGLPRNADGTRQQMTVEVDGTTLRNSLVALHKFGSNTQAVHQHTAAVALEHVFELDIVPDEERFARIRDAVAHHNIQALRYDPAVMEEFSTFFAEYRGWEMATFPVHIQQDDGTPTTVNITVTAPGFGLLAAVLEKLSSAEALEQHAEQTLNAMQD